MWNRRYIIWAMLRAYVKGEITREELQFTNEKQEEEVKNLEKKLLQAEKDYRSFLRQKKEKKQFVNALLSVKEKSVLTPELIRMLISKIILTGEVYGDKVSFWAYKGRIYGCISVSEKNQME